MAPFVPVTVDAEQIRMSRPLRLLLHRPVWPRMLGQEDLFQPDMSVLQE